MNFLYSVLFNIKMDAKKIIFGATRLAVSKTDPVGIGSSRKRYDMLPSLYPSILYHHIQPLSRLKKNLKVHFELRGTQDMIKTFSFVLPF